MPEEEVIDSGTGDPGSSAGNALDTPPPDDGGLGEAKAPTAEEIQAQEYVDSASAKGWRPQEEFEGGAGEFVDAKEFLQREPLFDKIRSQSKKLKGMEKTLNSMASQFQTQVTAQVELRTRELKAAKTEAIEAGDVAKVDQIDAEIDQQRTTAKPEAPVSAEVAEWIEKNPWYDENKEMQDWATTYNIRYVDRTGDVAGSLAKTAEAVKKAFPDHEGFAPPEKKRVTPPASPVEGGVQPKGTEGKTNYGVGRLSQDQKRVYDQMVKVHKIMSHEEYFQGLEEVGELS
jgi:hypothetical protein